MILALILMPMLAGAALFLTRSRRVGGFLLPACAVVHLCLTLASWQTAPAPARGGWLMLDATGKLFLTVISVVFLMTVAYVRGFPRPETADPSDGDGGFWESSSSESRFQGCLLLLLGTMTLVTASQHLGLLWVAIEATTLASAPLIYYQRNSRSLEATWKYLLICSVGIALALLGNFFLEVAAAKVEGVHGRSMVLSELTRNAGHFDKVWVKAAFILLLIGYGTKMGLAPMHTWLPDAYSESPSVAAPLLSGALINCAFIGVLRAQQVCTAAGLASFGEEAILLLGLLSMAVAAVFILGQTDYKRLLAYSSVENMGIMAVGVGLGGTGAFGSLLQAVNHSFTKAMLFFVAGNVLLIYKTHTIARVRGLIGRAPVTGALWLAGFMAITGTPPFGTFVSEFSILKTALDQGRYGIAAAYLALLGLIFIGMATAFLGMAQGEPEDPGAGRVKLHWLSVAPPLLLAGVVLLLGLYVPPPLTELLRVAARSLGGL